MRFARASCPGSERDTNASGHNPNAIGPSDRRDCFDHYDERFAVDERDGYRAAAV
jgi:hypothetical protein